MALDNLIQNAAGKIGTEIAASGSKLVDRVKQTAFDAVSETGFGRALRTVGLLPGANPLKGTFKAGAWDTGSNTDWRVRFSIPQTPEYLNSPLLTPLKETNGLVFPYTPTVTISHSAHYNAMTPTHSNYPFQIYANSAIDLMTVSGEFTVENSREAEYWIGAVHYLRSITKMAYGESSQNGAPPPVVKLNGYGDFVFKDIPVIVTNFTTNLDSEVDYIEARGFSPNGSWAPTRSTITISCIPLYSRDKVNKFSLDAFVKGDYLFENGTGYL